MRRVIGTRPARGSAVGPSGAPRAVPARLVVRLGVAPRVCLVAVVALAAAGPLSAEPGQGQPVSEAQQAGPPTTRQAADKLQAAGTKTGAPRDLPQGWYTRIETSMGSIVARLHPEQTPQTVAHFAGLAEGTLPWTDLVTGETRQSHFYDGLIVHRAVAGRQFEAGDPHGRGDGGPRMFSPLEEAQGSAGFDWPFRLGMTRSSLGRISASQFFITAASLPYLNRRHPCFGTVISGKEVVTRITSVKTYSNGKPVEPVILESVRVFKVGEPDPLAEPQPYEPETPRLQMREGLERRR